MKNKQSLSIKIADDKTRTRTNSCGGTETETQEVTRSNLDDIKVDHYTSAQTFQEWERRCPVGRRPRFSFVSLNTEPGYDKLTFTSGSWTRTFSGNAAQEVNTVPEESFVTVKFTTDGSVDTVSNPNLNGFHIKFDCC